MTTKTRAEILAEVATSAKQDEAKAVLDLLSTADKQDELIAKDFATQTTLAQVLAKIIAAPATEAKQDAIKAVLDLLATSAKQDSAKTVLDAIQAALEGTLSTQLMGSILGHDPVGDVPVQLTAVEDAATGRWYLGMVDAAPHGVVEEGDPL